MDVLEQLRQKGLTQSRGPLTLSPIKNANIVQSFKPGIVVVTGDVTKTRLDLLEKFVDVFDDTIQVPRAFAKGGKLLAKDSTPVYLDLSRLKQGISAMENFERVTINPVTSNGGLLKVETPNAMGFELLFNLVGDSVNATKVPIKITTWIETKAGVQAMSFEDTLYISEPVATFQLFARKSGTKLVYNSAGEFSSTEDATIQYILTPDDFIVGNPYAYGGRVVEVDIELSNLVDAQVSVYPSFYNIEDLDLFRMLIKANMMTPELFVLAMQKILRN